MKAKGTGGGNTITGLSFEKERDILEILKNAKAMAEVFKKNNIRMIGGGTDNHLILADVFGSLGVTGKEAQTVLDEVGITLNMNVIADDPRKPLDPSGIRFGTPAITTRGFKEKE